MNNELLVAIISGILSFLASIGIAWITAKKAWKNEIKKHVYEEREKSYAALFDLIQVIRDKPYSIFNYEMVIKPFEDLRTKLNLYASNDLLTDIEPFYEKVQKRFEEYVAIFDGEEYLLSRMALEECVEGSDPDVVEENYQSNHLIEEAEVVEIQRKLIRIMRRDIVRQ